MPRDDARVLYVGNARTAFLLMRKAGATSLLTAVRRTFAPAEIEDTTLSALFGDAIGAPNYVASGTMRPVKHFVTTVRDPFDRLVSFWAHLVRDGKYPNYFDRWGITPGMSFRQTVQAVCAAPDDDSNLHWKSQIAQMSIPSGGPRLFLPTLIVCLEQPDLTWAHLREIVQGNAGKRLADLPHENASTHPPVADFFENDRDLRNLVVHRYWQDFDRFGYDPCRFGPWKKRSALAPLTP